MIVLRKGDCTISILPVVNGLVSEAERVKNSMGTHESYAIALGVDGILALQRRSELEDDYEVSELDLVYAEHLSRFGEVEMPSPAMCAFIDCLKDLNITPVALDYNDEDYTDLYCKTVGTLDFVREHRLAKKGMKKDFTSDTPEALAIAWDEHVNKVKGYKAMSELREEHIADGISHLADFKKDILVCIEVERSSGVTNRLRNTHGMSQM